MRTRIVMICLAAALIVGCQTTRLSPLDHDSLVNGSDATSPDVAGEPGTLLFGDELQKALDDGLKASNGAGVSVAVIVPGYEPWVGVSGYSAVRPNGLVPMRPDMLFQIGSIEKNLTAALVLQLVEEGRLSLDDPVSRWVPGFDQIDPSITIRQLLNHTSGIYDWEDSPRSFTGLYRSEGYQAIDWSHSWTLDDVMALVEEPDFPPGQGWHYSNTGYRLARVIIEAETGMPISQALRTGLLEPLGLNHIWVECLQPAPEGIEFAHAWAEVNGDDNLDDISTQSPNLYCTILSSPTWTTAEDLARWSQALLYEGRVLSEESLAEMLTFIPASDPTEPLAAEYGLGVGKFNFKLVSPGNSRLAHLEHYGHSGSVIGYDATMIYLPEHHATVVALFNENATIGFTAGPLLEAVDRNLGGNRMHGFDNLQILFVVSAFLFQIVLIIHFGLRKWRFDIAMRYGWIVYALSIPAAAVSVLLLLGGIAWSLWLSGFLYLIWASYGFAVEYAKRIEWRNPIRWPIFGPYVFLYLATVLFYWFPLGLISKPLWYVYAVLFIVSTILNVTSHKRSLDDRRS